MAEQLLPLVLRTMQISQHPSGAFCFDAVLYRLSPFAARCAQGSRYSSESDLRRPWDGCCR